MAAIECSKVQDERPSSSTSGGQFGGGATATAGADILDFLADMKSDSLLQVRQLNLILA